MSTYLVCEINNYGPFRKSWLPAWLDNGKKIIKICDSNPNKEIHNIDAIVVGFSDTMPECTTFDELEVEDKIPVCKLHLEYSAKFLRTTIAKLFPDLFEISKDNTTTFYVNKTATESYKHHIRSAIISIANVIIPGQFTVLS